MSGDPCVLPRIGEHTHILKCWPKPFHAVLGHQKFHEVRKNDRCFRVGDRIMLKEWNPETEQYTGSQCLVLITYITEGGSFGLPEDLCVLSIKVEMWHLPNEPARNDQ